MPSNTGAAAAELAASLKRLRKAKGWSVRKLAEESGVSSANVWNHENDRLPKEDRLRELLDALDPPDDERERLIGLLRKAQGPGELAPGGTTINPTMRQILDYEDNASEMIHWEVGLICGLLQTADYARAVIGETPDASVLVKLRVGRSNILTRAENPVKFLALIDSEVFIRPIAPPEVMRQQLRHLLEMQQRPNVTIRIVPATAPGFHPGLHGPFKIYQFPRASSVVHLENYRAAPFLWDEGFVADYLAAAETLKKRAMTPEETSEAIEMMLHGLETP